MIGSSRVVQDEAILKDLKRKRGLDTWDETKFVWDIANWSQLPVEVCSPEFECAGAKWNLSLYPKGEDEPGSISIFLKCVDAFKSQQLGWSRDTSFKFGIANTKNHDTGKFFVTLAHQFEYLSSNWGIDEAIKESDLISRNILVDDSVSFILELRVFECKRRTRYVPHQDFAKRASAWALDAAKMGFELNVVPMQSISHDVKFNKPSTKLKPFVNSPVEADVALVIKIDEFCQVTEQTFFGHKKVLAASSKYFEAMFNPDSGFKEASEFTIKIELPITPSFAEMMFLLDFAYTGCKVVPVKEVKVESDSNDADDPNEFEDLETSNYSCLLRMAIIAEYLEMESFLTFLCEKLVSIGGNYFDLKNGWTEGAIISPGILSTLLGMCVGRYRPLRSMLQWLELTISCDDRPYGWDQTPEGLAQFKTMIDTFVIPQAEKTPFIDLPDILTGISKNLLSHLPVTAILPSILKPIN